jgi:hypothetical protein
LQLGDKIVVSGAKVCGFIVWNYAAV